MRKTQIALIALAITLCAALTLPAQASANEQLEQKIIDSCTYGEATHLELFSIDIDDLRETFYRLHDSGKLPWYVQRSFAYSYYEDTGKITEFTPKIMDPADCNHGLYEQKVAQILKETVMEGMSQWQIALSIHDYLIDNSQYDDAGTYTDGYDLLVRGTAVCNGYAEAYMDLMNRAGVPTVMVISEEMNHSWNLVCIDGKWYHVDVTWDDPTPNMQGRVNHDYFLLTDEEIKAGDDPHYNWKTDIACTDTAMSNGFWRGINSRICYLDDDTSFFLREDDYTNYIYSRNENDGSVTLLYTDEKFSINLGQGKYFYPHRGLSLWNGKLYFSSSSVVYSMNTDGSDVKAIFSYDTAGNKKCINSLCVKNDTLHLVLRDHDGNRNDMLVPISTGEYHTHTFTSVVVAPTCQENGYTTHTCACGLICQSDPVKTQGHNYRVETLKKATIFADGELLFTCADCGDSYTSVETGFNVIGWIFENETRGGAAISGALLLVFWLWRKIFPKKNVKVE